ncbi:MAG: VWA domain-containing protein [Fibrobacteria bacterium]|nr:VWA domain-containing protein [Fibrobacteria bacterium]
MIRRFVRCVPAVLFALALISCRDQKLAESLTIVSGSENQTLEPLLQEFARSQGVSISMDYKGSVDIMNMLSDGPVEADAVWPANSLWISLGDRSFQVKQSRSIMVSPVVFAIRGSAGKRLGLDSGVVTIDRIRQAIQDGRFSFAMTSATQSNSGAAAYLGFLHAMSSDADSSGVLSLADLADTNLLAKVRGLLGGINRSAGSSNWLKDLVVQRDYEAMMNYEALVIEANQALVKAGKEPFQVVYPVDGLALADSPLGYIHHGDDKKRALFEALQAWLLTPEVQARLVALGRRPAALGVPFQPDPDVFRSSWGIETKRILSPAPTPAAEVVRKALELYQIELRKPSATVYCLDYSGSMDGSGHMAMVDAMRMLLTPSIARRNMLQNSTRDLTWVIAFSDHVLETWKMVGNDSTEQEELLRKIRTFRPEGGTDIYSPLVAALDTLASLGEGKYSPAVILMTDGVSNIGRNFEDLSGEWSRIRKTIPVFPIMFGEASSEQLDPISELTTAQTLDGRSNLAGAFRKARGNN